ncbi:MAG: 3-hydroxyacyl-ACP dehydratase FabZ [Burkholderiales bacterium]|nr:3-hydroxyacyl-ACP dehydratase FabZ [Burkholderiales bacterium]GIK86993.1 MAG: 3-hydroxyacyl-[acyl-carrier-protein] dehydratase FabZ [Betaproteobacteria bacterium]
MIDVGAVVAKMPHRYPMVLVDRVLECTPGRSMRAVKGVTISEPYFQGHFPGYPVMPGVLILEALTQLCGALAVASGLADADGAPALSFDGVDGCRFKRQVVPGDQLVLEVQWRQDPAAGDRFDVRAFVDGQLAAEAELLASRTSRAA